MASKIIAKNEQEHREILLLFNYLTYWLEGGLEAELDVTKLLRDLRKQLESHITQEDKKIYDKLDETGDAETVGVTKKFSDEMRGISEKVNAFLDKYSLTADELKKSKTVKQDLKEIIKIVSDRIALEEAVLFPIYRKHFGNQ